MANYHAANTMSTNTQNITTTAKEILQVSAITATIRRGQVYDILMGANDAPNATDCAIQYFTQRVSTSGTSSTNVPAPLDTANSATTSNAWANHTADGTSGVHLLDLSLNQRASQRWVAAPGSELVWPATTLNGVGLWAKSSNYASTVVVAFMYTDL